MFQTDTSKRVLYDSRGRERKGAYMHTSNGAKYWPFDPRPEEVHIGVIAHQLAGLNRWQGAVRHPVNPALIFYSVGEHSVYVARYVERVLGRPDLALEALLHDASEAYIGDLIRPLKYDPRFHAPFKEVEEINERAIAEAFNLVYPFPKEVKLADEAVCEAESRFMVVRDPGEEWESGLLHETHTCADIAIEMMNPYTAKIVFLTEFHRLAAHRDKFREMPARFR